MSAVSEPAPQHCPSAVELDDLELLLGHAVPGVDGFNQPDSPLTLSLPDPVAEQATAAGAVELVDPEGLPLARVAWPAGTVVPLAHAAFGPFRSTRLTPAQYRRAHPGRTVVPVADALTERQLDEIDALGPVTLLAFVGANTPDLSPVALVRASLAAAALLDDAVVVSVPLASHGDPEVDHDLGAHVTAAYAGGDPVHGIADDEDGTYPPEIAAIVRHDQPPPAEQGLVLFFTGLSGSGKSTLARALVDRLLEQGRRSVTSLDGDVVRRHLSAGLTFSKADRETNIRRIGWVAAEIARHGGVAVVSPIAPFDETRQQVRAMVADAGGAFFLIHVATPLEECERRDRKGLYAKARAGEIPEFTGISSPYEEPQDADVRVDTTGRTIEDALDDVLVALRTEGYLDLLEEPHESVVDETPLDGRGADATKERGVTRPGEPRLEPHPAAGPLKILFVCTANICRSASLEVLARHTHPSPDVVFESAGTHGFVDAPLDPAMAAALPPGLETSAFRSRPLTPAMVEQADLVLTMEAAHRDFILRDQPQLFRKVYTLGQFAQAVAKAPTGLDREELLAHIGATRGPADPTLDVLDPYRRGPEAASGCVARLEELLHAVLPALTR
jgi:sulfate adenylyltransferase